jgi:RIO kinase 2
VIVNVVEAYGKLTKRDLRTLRVIEAGHKYYEYVPQELIERWSRCRREEVAQSIRRMHALGLLRRSHSAYLGWRITAAGYDVLALHTLRARQRVARVSPTPIGVGKEAAVYAGEMPSGFKVALKFYRGGASAFRYDKAFRSRVRKFRHLKQVYETRLSALAEYFALRKIFDAGGIVPEPLAYNRHVVVMSYINGVELHRLADGDFKRIADDIVTTLLAALRAGIIHGDLSPYNVIVGERGYVIDWPQWVPVWHQNAAGLLLRDINNIASYFRKRGVELPVSEVMRAAEEGGSAARDFIAEMNKYLFRQGV